MSILAFYTHGTTRAEAVRAFAQNQNSATLCLDTQEKGEYDVLQKMRKREQYRHGIL